ncbi:MAG: hypothetical protein MJ224_03485 [archaeon]|nr:hypothetical protein [archaeon]
MVFNWDLFSDVAFHLKDYSDKEEYLRSSVGRFYYAAFGLTKDYYEKTHHKVVPHVGAHSFLINSLLDSVYDEEVELGEHLRELKNYRVNSDYNNNFNKNFVNTAQNIYILLRNLINFLNKNPVVPKF